MTNKNELFIHDSSATSAQQINEQGQYLCCATRVEGSASGTIAIVSSPSFFFLCLGAFFFLSNKSNYY